MIFHRFDYPTFHALKWPVDSVSQSTTPKPDLPYPRAQVTESTTYVATKYKSIETSSTSGNLKMKLKVFRSSKNRNA